MSALRERDDVVARRCSRAHLDAVAGIRSQSRRRGESPIKACNLDERPRVDLGPFGTLRAARLRPSRDVSITDFCGISVR